MWLLAALEVPMPDTTPPINAESGRDWLKRGLATRPAPPPGNRDDRTNASITSQQETLVIRFFYSVLHRLVFRI